MKNSDEAIEQVLSALREAEAPAGMGRRILKTLEEQVSTRAQSGWHRSRPIWLMTLARPIATRAAVCGVAFAGLFVMGLTIYSIHAVRRPGHAQLKIGTARTALSLPATSEAVANSAQLTPHGSTAEFTKRPNTGEKAKTSRAGAAGNADAVALHAMLAISYPAPPMPLTEQEKLLLRIANRRDPVELARLEPMLRNVPDAEEKEEFQQFFGQSTASQSAAEPTAPPAAKQTMPDQPATAQPTSAQPIPAKPTKGENE